MPQSIAHTSCNFCGTHTPDDPVRRASEALTKLGIFRLEVGEFIVIPDVSPIRTGHLLILPLEHSTSLMAMTNDARSELEGILAWLLHLDLFASGGLMFEHASCTGGWPRLCQVEHAHIHVCPMDADEFQRLVRCCHDELGEGHIDHAMSLAAEAENAADYLWIRHSRHGRSWTFVPNGGVPAQFVRKKLAALGIIDTIRSNWLDFLEFDHEAAHPELVLLSEELQKLAMWPMGYLKEKGL